MKPEGVSAIIGRIRVCGLLYMAPKSAYTVCENI